MSLGLFLPICFTSDSETNDSDAKFENTGFQIFSLNQQNHVHMGVNRKTTNKNQELLCVQPCVAVEIMDEDKEGKIEEATGLVTALVISLADDVISR